MLVVANLVAQFGEFLLDVFGHSLSNPHAPTAELIC
jgi:hypothetical protein